MAGNLGRLRLFAILSLSTTIAFWDAVAEESFPKREATDFEHKTRFGTLTGQKVTSTFEDGTTSNFYVFKKIPFAKPPIGKLRWEDPIYLPKWEGKLDAREYGPKCAQVEKPSLEFRGQEDCLYLNIYTSDLKGNQPVLNFIHGGGFQEDSGRAYYPDRIVRNGLVVVTSEYRLTLFGFLATNSEILPGNYGLLDQEAALRWVNENIREFGGDSKQVTIAGESAGSASTHFMMLSPRTQEMFHRVILESGFSNCDWATTGRAKLEAMLLAKATGCLTVENDEGLRAAITCMKQKPPEEVAKKYLAAKGKQLFFPTFLTPVIDGRTRTIPYVPENPAETIKKYNKKKPVLMGVNEEEGAAFAVLFGINLGESWSKFIQEKFSSFLIPELFEDLVYTENESLNGENTKDIKAKYFTDIPEGDETEYISRASSLIGDRMFVSCGANAAKAHAKNGLDVHSYVFKHRGEPGLLNPILQLAHDKNITLPKKFWTDPTHFDEMFYWVDLDPQDFGALQGVKGFTVSGLSEEDAKKSRQKMTEKMIRIWSNFAKNGKVDEDGWVRVSEEKPTVETFVLDNNKEQKMIDGYRPEVVEFWNSLKNQKPQ